MVGDRLDTDIQFGHGAGVPTVLVLTGVSTIDEVRPVGPSPSGYWRHGSRCCSVGLTSWCCFAGDTLSMLLCWCDYLVAAALLLRSWV